jgi:hypothetical protein
MLADMTIRSVRSIDLSGADILPSLTGAAGMTQHRNRVLVALAASVFLAYPATAATLDELAGRWCGRKLEYTFTHDQLSVTSLRGGNLRHGTTLQIVGSKPITNGVRVIWHDASGTEFWTNFEVSGDALIQLPQSKGDKGPRRVYRRCK